MCNRILSTADPCYKLISSGWIKGIVREKEKQASLFALQGGVRDGPGDHHLVLGRARRRGQHERHDPDGAAQFDGDPIGEQHAPAPADQLLAETG